MILLALLVIPGFARAGECVAIAPSTLAEQLRDTLANGDNVAAVAAVRAAEPGFGCLQAFVTPDDLVAVYQLAGTAAYYSPRRAEADALFRRAAVVGPNVPFDAANLGTDAATLYATVREQVTRGPTGTLVTRGAVVVDGATVRGGSTWVVPTGTHLVQENQAGDVRSSLVELGEGGLVYVGTPDPVLVAAQEDLLRRRRAGLLYSAGALFLAGGGLFTAAVAQEAALRNLDPETTEDPEQYVVRAQERINACTIGAVMASGAGVGVGVRGLTFGIVVDPDAPPATLRVAARW